MDPIERQTAIDAAIEAADDWDGGYNLTRGNMIEEAIKKLPSAQPEQRWIPVSETIDIPDHEILACDKYGELMFGYLAYEDEQWMCESDGDIMYDPTAWREKPEPYREDG